MNKVINLRQLKKIRINFKNKKIGLCHGAFDILHNGHLFHFKEAKKKVDILVVSVTADKFIFKGPNQPYNNENARAKFLEHISIIDYIYIDNNLTAEKILADLKPDIYFKGKDYNEKDLTGNLNKEIKILKKNKGKILITQTQMLSSTKIVNNFFKPFESNIDNYLRNLKKNNAFEKIKNVFSKLEEKTINVIGEPIIDTYIHCEMAGLTTKDPAVSSIIKKKEVVPGGVIAVAKIISKFVKQVNFYSFGKTNELKKIFKNYKNTKVINLDTKQPMQIKTRYINSTRYEKLLQVTNFRKNTFSYEAKKSIVKKIKKIKKNLIICDFGIGLFEDEVLQCIENLKAKKFLNVQSNSMNLGYNLFTKYKSFNYLSLDEREWKLALGEDKIKSIGKIMKLKKNNKLSCSITLGKQGSEYLWKNQKAKSPVFIEKTLDTTGCGDAYFAITSLMIECGLEKNLISFVGNSYAGMHSQFFGNSKITEKITFAKYIKSILNR